MDHPSQTEEPPMKTDRNDTDDLIVLTRVPPELAPLIVGLPTKYRDLTNKLANAEVPAELVEYIRGRYYVRRSNLAAFGQALGLPLRSGTSPTSRRSAA
jgi:hypothetical protein